MTDIFFILDYKSKFWKNEKIKQQQQQQQQQQTPGDIIILHKCTINDNDMMYGSWDMEHDRQNVF